MSVTSAIADKDVPMRRTISTEKPMWLIHIDTWNWADPQKIISLIPEDIRPYVVMNISLSISHNDQTGEMNIAPNGYEIAKSWLRACAENRMWAVVQCSSGGFSHFSEYDMSIYEEFYREYPNFLGWNYCEQFWGFDDPFSCSFSERLNHFADLMELSHKYGGFLIVSFCGEHYGASLNPVAMMKKDKRFKNLCQEYSEHFIMCEKFTMTSCFYDNESVNFGAFASGFAGTYGIRFDVCGWGDDANYPHAAGAIPIMEHMMFTGMTVTDGPELIWTQCFKEVNAITTNDGFISRKWEKFPQFENISIDLFRKILDKTVRILTRDEVIKRTKVVLINDINTGSDWDIYASPLSLYDGLYAIDGPMNNNKTWTKKTGRYPAIPIVAELADDIAETFPIKIKKSEFSKRWPDTQSKIDEFNTLFPEEYSGDIYASRNENTWLTYNPHRTEKNASGTIPLKYNTCEKIELHYSPYSMGIVKEYSDNISLYLTNYRADDKSLKTDTIYIYGSDNEPTYNFKDRASHALSKVTHKWKDNLFTLYVTHNGPLDLIINCKGSYAERLNDYKDHNIAIPDFPSIYTGPRQYEAECFDYKNISRNYTNGFNSGIKNYTGQGYLNFGKNSGATIRDTVSVHKKGNYLFKLRYSAPAGNITSASLFINGKRISYINLLKTKSSSDWNTYCKEIYFNEGKNEIQIKYMNNSSFDLYMDNIIIEPKEDGNIYDFTHDIASDTASDPAAALINVLSGSAGVVSFNGNHVLKTYSIGENKIGVADLDLINRQNTNYSIIWKEYYNNDNRGDKGVLLRGTDYCNKYKTLNCGYLFLSEINENNTVTLKPYIVNKTDIIEQNQFSSDFKISTNNPCWFRASAFDNKLIFECSNDSINWHGAESTTFNDNSYNMGTTQFVWGINSYVGNWMIDNITSLISNISISYLELNNFKSVKNEDYPETKNFNLSAKDLTDKVRLSASEGFELSIYPDKEFSSSLEINNVKGKVNDTTIYVRLNSNQEMGDYLGNINITSNLNSDRNIRLSGKVVPPTISLKYDFTEDTPKNSYTNPPAKDISVATGNLAKAGVISYKSLNEISDNALMIYDGGNNRNGTGVINLNRFTDECTDYGITWKQYISSNTESYKTGVILRGDKNNIGTSKTGYTQGLMHGYVFIAYNNKSAGNTEFRIYSSTESTNLNMHTNVTVSINPVADKPIWYRASVSGIAPVILKFEYSLDNETWTTATSYSDINTSFANGSSQFLWGLAAAKSGFYIDDIIFKGITYDQEIIMSDNILHNEILNISETQYYTIMGERIYGNKNNLRGIFIIKYIMSDGTSRSEKIICK